MMFALAWRHRTVALLSPPRDRASRPGQVAQLVEQWTENPCVTGSIPVLPNTLKRKRRQHAGGVLRYKKLNRLLRGEFRLEDLHAIDGRRVVVLRDNRLIHRRAVAGALEVTQARAGAVTVDVLSAAFGLDLFEANRAEVDAVTSAAAVIRHGAVQMSRGELHHATRRHDESALSGLS